MLVEKMLTVETNGVICLLRFIVAISIYVYV